jgi:hypothetical protein|tara:strand:+ start:3766 stop:3942 length:177 start_codon:yes stop_codon:yes gene_type:complete
MKVKTFSVTLLLQIDEDNNILGAYEDAHTEDISDLVRNTFYDIDDVTVQNILIKERYA